MTSPDLNQEKARREQELRIQRQIAFASGIFQEDVTVRTLLESLAEGVIVIDNSGTILLINTAAEKMFGYSKEDLIGRPHAILIPEPFRAIHEEHEADYFKEPRIRPMGQLLELAGRRSDGSEFPVEISLGYIVTINGVLVLALVSDMAVRKQFEARLKESERRFASFMLHLPAAAWIKDLNGQYVYANTEAERIFSAPLSELQGKTDDELFPPETARQFRENDERVKAEDGSFQTIEVLRQADGIEHHSMVSKFAVPGPDGRTAYVAGVAFDITERVRTEEALRFSEARFRALHDDNPVMIFTLDEEGTVVSANPACTSQLGYTADELAGEPVLKIFHEEDRPAVAEQLRQCQQNLDQVHHWQFRKVRKDGRLLWVEEIARAIYDLNGAINVLVVCQDITERKRAEEAIQKSEEKFSMIFNMAPVGITISTLADGKFVDINAAGERFSGYRRDEVIGRTALEFDIWKDPQERTRTIEEVLKQGGVHDREMMMKDKGGNVFWASFSAVATEIRGERYLLSLVNDITARKRAEEEIERLNAELAARAADLEAANRELEAFNYTVAHDLRKPLTTINGYYQLIRELCDDQLDERCKTYLQEAYDGTWRMNRLIDTLLNFSSVTRREPHRETVDLSAMAQAVANELTLSEPARRVTFRVTEGISVIGDASLLHVVLENLFGNAWKFTGMREEAVIEFGMTEIDGQPACFVRDNGPGFAKEDADKLFIPFQRLPGTEEYRGFGIGLATVDRIIRRHGGRVWAVGELGNGATFYFTLPEYGVTP
jgi:PAS domain S-box-containing protein